LYQLHWPDPKVPLAESLDALKQVQKEGLIRTWGVGNLSAKELREQLAPGGHIPHQFHMSLLTRNPEILLAGSESSRCLNCVYSPLEQGLLTDAPSARGVDALGSKDHRRHNPHFTSPTSLAWVTAFHKAADQGPIPRVALALLWLLAQPGVDVIIPGPRTREQLFKILETRRWLTELGGLGEGLNEALEDAVGTASWQLLQGGPAT